MNRKTSIELTRRLIQRVTTNSTDEAPEPMTEPASVFLDPVRHELERERLFFTRPQVIGFAGEVAEPSYFITATVVGIPIVVTRAGDGVLRAFVNACGHRGARVAKGCGTKKRLTCGFHGWSYALDGSLAGRPKDSAFAAMADESPLTQLPVSDRSGLIVVGAHSNIDQEQVDHALDDIAPVLEALGFDRVHRVNHRRIDVAANWKLVVNLSHEGYHFPTLHRESLAPVMTGHGVVDFFGQHSRWAFAQRGIEQLAETHEDDWPTDFPGAANHTIFPGTVIVVSANSAQMIRVEPGDNPGKSVVYYSGVCKDVDKIEQSREDFKFGGDIFEQEDLSIAVQCQEGLTAGQATVVIGRNEPVVQFWHRLWNQVLG